MDQTRRLRKQGLYDPRFEHDACGVGFVANIKGRKSHTIVEQGLTVLRNLTHRGAVGWDPKLSDGAGILIRMGRWLRKRRNLPEKCNSPTESRHSYEMVGTGVEPGCPLHGSSARGPPHIQSGPTPSQEIVSLRGFNVDRATLCSGNTEPWEMVAPWATRRTNCAGSPPR